MSYHGRPNWPPVWLWIGKGKPKYPQGELGRLKKVEVSVLDPNRRENPRPHNRIFLSMEYLGARYLGCLLFEDAATCQRIGAILAKHRGKSLHTIGDIDLSRLL